MDAATSRGTASLAGNSSSWEGGLEQTHPRTFGGNAALPTPWLWTLASRAEGRNVFHPPVRGA